MVVLVPLNKGHLLTFREKTLREHNNQLLPLPVQRRKHRSTEESRMKHEHDYRAAYQRRQQRKEQHTALQSYQLLTKLQKLEQSFSKSQELGYAQINKIKLRMKKEQEIFHGQRSEILVNAETVSYEEYSFILVWLAVCSPLWIPLIFIRHFYTRYSGNATSVSSGDMPGNEHTD